MLSAMGPRKKVYTAITFSKERCGCVHIELKQKQLRANVACVLQNRPGANTETLKKQIIHGKLNVKLL